MDDPDPTMTKWKRLHNAFVTRQNRSGNRRAILEFIRQALKPQPYARDPLRFETLRDHVNRALAFSGLAVEMTGTLHATNTAQTIREAANRAQELRATLATRGVHPDVLKFCRAELVADNYFHAVLEAMKSIADKLRSKTGLTADAGTLATQTLAGDPLNRRVTESPGRRAGGRGFFVGVRRLVLPRRIDPT